MTKRKIDRSNGGPITTELARLAFGNDAIYAGECMMVLTDSPEQDGIQRTMFGGVLLASMDCGGQWERSHGSLIFIPSPHIPRMVSAHVNGYRIDQLLCGSPSPMTTHENWKVKK